MAAYYAITRRNGRWVYVNSGADPQEVYQDAVVILENQVAPGDADDEDAGLGIPPTVEYQINDLRIVTEEAARDTYHIIGSQVKM